MFSCVSWVELLVNKFINVLNIRGPSNLENKNDLKLESIKCKIWCNNKSNSRLTNACRKRSGSGKNLFWSNGVYSTSNHSLSNHGSSLNNWLEHGEETIDDTKCNKIYWKLNKAVQKATNNSNYSSDNNLYAYCLW